MLARAFAPFWHDSESIAVFASGVSDSQCTADSEFRRERELLGTSLSKHADADAFVYFSTCSIFDPCAQSSAYVQHKLKMEELASQHPAHLVVRLPVVVGPTGNRKSLVKFLAERIRAGEPIEVWKNAGRYLIDIDDVVSLCSDLVSTEISRNERINVAGPNDMPLPELVQTLAQVIGKEPICVEIERGARYPLDTSRIGASVSRLNIRFDERYVERTLQKYYGSSRSS